MTWLRLAVALTAAAFIAAPAFAQDESLRYRTGVIKVGDRIDASPTSNGTSYPCVVTGIRDASGWRPGYDGDFLLRCDGTFLSSVPATADHARPSAAPPVPAPEPAAVARAAPAAPAGAAPAAVAPAAAAPAAVAPAAARPPAAAPVAVAVATPTRAQATAPGGNAFGTRDPRPCDRVTSTPSAAQAAQLVACAREGQSSRSVEYVVQDVSVTSFAPSTYDPHTQTGFTNMDTSVAPIAIRGSLVAWDCRPVDGPGVMAKYSNVGQNCGRQVERNAAGYCYKLRTGAWSCSMNDTAIAQADKQYNLPPPR